MHGAVGLVIKDDTVLLQSCIIYTMARKQVPSAVTSPPFSPYESIPQTSAIWTDRKFDAIKKWVLTEKVHGANLSLTAWMETSETVKVKIGKRKGFLREGEAFFGLQTQVELIEQLKKGAEKVFHALSKDNHDLWAVIVYGELFGGYYPHKSVPAVKKVSSVQKEVAYCPGLQFVIFDIALLHQTGTKEYLSYKAACVVAEQSGLMYLQPLLTGTLKDVTHYRLGFETTIPRILGLPPITDNLAEGVVIKPLEESACLETSKGTKRVIIKRIFDKFAQRRQMTGNKRAESDQKQYGPTDEQLLQYEVSAMMTDHRVTNVISKLGFPADEEGWSEVVLVMVEEVKEDLENDCPELMQSCEEETVMVIIERECREQVQDYQNTHKN